MDKIRFTPLYLQVKDAIFERVLAGEWPPGSFLPNEFALAEQYGVSQGTLRKALEELTQEKHLIRYQGKGTVVADFNKHNSVFPFCLIFDKSEQRVYPLTRALYHDTRVAPKEIADALNLNENEEVIFAERLRPDGEDSEEIIMREMIYIPKKFFSEETLENFESYPPRLYSYYIKAFAKPVSSAVESFTIGTADATDEKFLGVTEHSPILVIRRISYSANQEPVEIRFCTINSEKYSYRSNII